MTREAIAILDFGSQYTQLIARRMRELGVYSEILPPDIERKTLASRTLKGIVLSGGPDSVYRVGPRDRIRSCSSWVSPCWASATACSG